MSFTEITYPHQVVVFDTVEGAVALVGVEIDGHIVRNVGEHGIAGDLCAEYGGGGKDGS